jgi:RNA polymerase sigma-54 factor
MVIDVLKAIQQFDPVGVAARDMKECLLLQLQYTSPPSAETEIAKKIITYSFEDNAVNNANKIIKKLGITEPQFKSAMNVVKKLNPNPGRQYSNTINNHVEPELYVKKIKDKWQVFLADSILTNVKINKEYQQLIKQSKKLSSQNSLQKELQEAQWLLKGLQRRNETLLKVASYIVEVQYDFFENGAGSMKPLTNADVAQMVDVHESTISRVTSGKYVATPHGVFELKYFFPTQLSQQGRICSDTAVKQLILKIVSQETGEKVYSDSDIAKLLSEQGIQIARRTVAKYREALNILPSYQRAKLQFDLA